MIPGPDPSSDDPPAASGFTRLGQGFVPFAIDDVQALLPHLEILGFLGHGGMGTYYRARQPKLDRVVSLKTLPVDARADAELIEKFQREAGTMAGLSHPNIVKIYDFGRTERFLYLIMEYVEGEILERLIFTHRFNLEEVLAIVSQLCAGLDYAHRQGVVHRDLRLGNTLFDDQGQVKVADFGLARLLGDELFRHNLTEANRAMGTFDYVAPEQLDPAHPVDHRADIYSVGLMLYKLLTHTLPRGTFVPPSSVTPGLDPGVDDIVIRCMQRNPENRFDNVTALWTAVSALYSTRSAARPAVRFRFSEP